MSFIQIQSGIFARHRLIVATHTSARPTSDRVKSSLFGILANLIPDRVIIDLFAGTGAIGFEALSRGAKHAVFVEIDQKMIRYLRQNSSSLNCDDHVTIIQDCATRRLPKLLESFPDSICFIDPPYETDLVDRVLTIIGDSNKLFSGIAITEGHHKQTLASEYQSLRPDRTERYGETRLVFWSFPQPREKD